ncbi:MAG: TolB family protein, partial [Candidatus Binatia bacterium]
MKDQQEGKVSTRKQQCGSFLWACTLTLVCAAIDPQPATAQVTITQITNTQGGLLGAQSGRGVDTPSINADGTRITFRSGEDLTGGNADGSEEIFLFDTTTSTFTQLTTARGGPFGFGIQLSISADGTRVAFESDGDLTGTNADGNQEIFLFDTTTGTTMQVTDTAGGPSGQPSINAAGTRIAFTSNRDLTGGNADNSFEIFLFDSNTGFKQITNSTGGFSFDPAINADGTRIAFLSTED